MSSEDFRYSDDENDENKLERPSEEQVPEKISSRKRRQDDVCIKNEALNQSFAEINKNSNKHNSSTPHSAKRLKQNNFHSSNISTRKSMRKSVNSTTAQESTWNDNDHSRSMIDPRFFCETTSNESINRDASERQESGAEQVNNENISSGSFTQVDNTNALQIQSVYSSVEDEADRAFFESIKPSLRKMDPFKKLDFKIEVLQLLKKHLN